MEILHSLWVLIVSGAPEALTGILFALIIYLVWERQKMTAVIKQYQQKIDESRDHYTESIEQILERYHNGNIELIQALNEIKIVLAMMQKSMY